MRTIALKTRLAAVAALALAGCGKPLLYAEVEIPDVRVSLSELSFASTSNPDPVDLCPPGVVLTSPQTCIQKGVEIDLGKDFTDLTKDAVDYELRLTQLGITLTSTTLQDFGQVAEVHVAVSVSRSSRTNTAGHGTASSRR